MLAVVELEARATLFLSSSWIRLLKRNAGIELKGRKAVILGRSNLVGKPVAQLLLRENATMTICHSRTQDLAEVASRADILIVASGRQQMDGARYVKDGAVVIDVGIHKTEDGGLVGDVRFEEVEPKASTITPVQGGIGPWPGRCFSTMPCEQHAFRRKWGIGWLGKHNALAHLGISQKEIDK